MMAKWQIRDFEADVVRLHDILWQAHLETTRENQTMPNRVRGNVHALQVIVGDDEPARISDALRLLADEIDALPPRAQIVDVAMWGDDDGALVGVTAYYRES